MFTEASKKDPKQKKEWIALVDGDKNQIKYLKKQAKANKIKLTIICDFIHALEYLWDASNDFYKDSEEREVWVKRQLHNLLESKASLCAAGMRRSATRRNIESNKRKSIDKCAKYLLNHSSYFDYSKYLEKGYPIATGVIEGACKHLVQDRMGITGARWSLGGAEAILKLRSLKVSGEFDNYWVFHEEQEFRRNYEDSYADLKIIEKTSKNLSF